MNTNFRFLIGYIRLHHEEAIKLGSSLLYRVPPPAAVADRSSSHIRRKRERERERRGEGSSQQQLLRF